MTASVPTLKRAAKSSRDLSPPPLKRSAIQGVKQNTVANFFKPASEKVPENITWKVYDNSLITAKYVPTIGPAVTTATDNAKRKIAAFDFDSTLIKTKSGNNHAKDGGDWQWWHRDVPGKLKQLHADGYMITIISNQAGISLKPDPKLPAGHKKRYADFKVKSTSIFNQLQIPVALYAATEHDTYRKPRSGMWQVLFTDYNLTPDMIDMEQSVFVGDAAGRIADETHKADFSCGDRNLADNLGLTFRTPEEFFLGEQPRPFVRSFEPSRYVQSNGVNPIIFSKKHDLDIVVFVGSPGSGKSTFYQKELAPLGYNRVNQDILKKREKCLEVAQEHLKHLESVVVDNTNRDIATRKVWVDLAKSFNVPIRCVYFPAESALCEHNNVVRALNEAHNPEKRTILPSSAFPMYRKAFQSPELAEGFEDITRVEFMLEGTEEQCTAWAKYWT